MKELLLLTHPVVGVFGIFSTLWLCVELLNVHRDNIIRIKWASLAVPFFMVLTWITSGYWYVHYYAADKAIILKGPWPFAHKIIMETKEHVFFITLVLSLLLPFVVFTEKLVTNKSARVLVYTIAIFIILSALSLEAAGSLITMAVKEGLLNPTLIK